MPRVPSFQQIIVGTPFPVPAYNELAILPGTDDGSYVIVTNSVGETHTVSIPTVLGSKQGGMDNWGAVTLQAFVSDGQVAINSEVTFGA